MAWGMATRGRSQPSGADEQGARPFFPGDETNSAIDLGDALKLGGTLSSLVLAAVERSGSWRVEFAWPSRTKRYFGNFSSRVEAEKWIEEHRRLIERPEEPDNRQRETDDY